MKKWAGPISALLAAFAVCGLGTLMIGRTAFRAASAMEEQAAKEAVRLVELARADRAEVQRVATERFMKGDYPKWQTEGKPKASGPAKALSMRLDTSGGKPQTRAIFRVPVTPGPDLEVTLVQEGDRWLLDALRRLP
jgi:hypothetical protein